MCTATVTCSVRACRWPLTNELLQIICLKPKKAGSAKALPALFLNGRLGHVRLFSIEQQHRRCFMSNPISRVDPEGLLEYSVVYTDRALNHMSKRFQGVMQD